MNIIVCLDDKNGMMFHKRRQSADRELRKHLLQFVKEGMLWMSPYSASQFSELPDFVRVDESFFSYAAEEDYCFVESGDWTAFAESIKTIVVYRWNRRYPSDLKLDLDPEACGLHRIGVREFVGTSHEKITREEYRR